MNKRAKSTQPNPSPRSSTQQSARNASRTRSPNPESPVEECFDCRARITSKELAPSQSENGCRFGEKCSYAQRQVDEQPCKRSKKNCDKRCSGHAVKSTRQLGCVSQDTESPKSSSILRKSLDILMPIRCVRFTKAVLRHADIRDQNPSLGMICPGDPHHRNPNAPKFEDRSQEETNGKSDVPVKQRGGWPKIS